MTYGDITIASKGLQNQGLYMLGTYMVFNQGGDFTLPHCCDMGPWFSWPRAKDHSNLDTLYDKHF